MLLLAPHWAAKVWTSEVAGLGQASRSFPLPAFPVPYPDLPPLPYLEMLFFLRVEQGTGKYKKERYLALSTTCNMWTHSSIGLPWAFVLTAHLTHSQSIYPQGEMKGLWIQGVTYLPFPSPVNARPTLRLSWGNLILTSIFKYFYNVPFNLILHL